MCKAWRHRIQLVESWIRVTVTFHSKLMLTTLGPSHFAAPNSHGYEKHSNAPLDPTMPAPRPTPYILAELPESVLPLSWALLSDIIGDVNDLSRPSRISHTEKFVAVAVQHLDLSGSGDAIFDPEELPCLVTLPLNFLKALSGISCMVDMTLGLAESVQPYLELAWPGLCDAMLGRNDIGGGADSGVPELCESLVMLSKNRVLRSSHKVPIRGVLHYYGPLLLQASLLQWREATGNAAAPFLSGGRADSDAAHGALVRSNRRGAFPSRAWSPGRAEACGALCRIFSMRHRREYVSITYTARFALALAVGFSDDEQGHSPDLLTLTNAIGNAADVFRSQLTGFECLVPALCAALELCLLGRHGAGAKQRHERRRCIWSPIGDTELHPELDRARLRQAAVHAATCYISQLRALDRVRVSDVRRVIFDDAKPRDDDADKDHCDAAGLRSSLASIILRAADGESDASCLLLELGVLGVLMLDGSVRRNNRPTNRGAEHNRQSLAARVICCAAHLLESRWLYDLAVAQALLELLISAARAGKRSVGASQDLRVGKRVLRSVSRYILEQMKRPPLAHSKELHSKIILAYTCFEAWLLAQPRLLGDADTRRMVSNVLELGTFGAQRGRHMAIGGSGSGAAGRDIGSSPSSTSSITLKHEATLNPISIRVREVADAARASVYEQLLVRRQQHDAAAQSAADTLGKRHLGSSSFESATPVKLKGRDDHRRQNARVNEEGSDVCTNTECCPGGCNNWLLAHFDEDMRCFIDDAQAGDSSDHSSASQFYAVDDALLTIFERKERRNVASLAEATNVRVFDAEQKAPLYVVSRTASGRHMWRFQLLRRSPRCINSAVVPRRRKATDSVAELVDAGTSKSCRRHVVGFVVGQFRRLSDQLPGTSQIPSCDADNILPYLDELGGARLAGIGGTPASTPGIPATPIVTTASEQQDDDGKQRESLPSPDTWSWARELGFAVTGSQNAPPPTYRNMWSDLTRECQLMKRQTAPMPAGRYSPETSRLAPKSEIRVTHLLSNLGMRAQHTNGARSPTATAPLTGNSASTDGGITAAGKVATSTATPIRVGHASGGAQPTAAPTPVSRAAAISRPSAHSPWSARSGAIRLTGVGGLGRSMRSAALMADLSLLDAIPSRPLNWLFSFYVDSPSDSLRDVLANGSALGGASGDRALNPLYLKLLESLGRWTRLDGNTGDGTGNGDADCEADDLNDELASPEMLGDGRDSIIYYDDSMAHLVTLVPSSRCLRSPKHQDATTSSDMLDLPAFGPKSRLLGGAVHRRGSVASAPLKAWQPPAAGPMHERARALSAAAISVKGGVECADMPEADKYSPDDMVTRRHGTPPVRRPARSALANALDASNLRPTCALISVWLENDWPDYSFPLGNISCFTLSSRNTF